MPPKKASVRRKVAIPATPAGDIPSAAGAGGAENAAAPFYRDADRLELREACRDDLKRFAREFFGDHCRLPWSLLHDYLFERRHARLAQPPEAREPGLDIVLAPRGAAKSTLVSLVFPVHAMLYRLEGFIVLISATQYQARGRMANLRAALSASARLRECFPEELATLGRASTRSLELNGVRLDAVSAGSELRGISHGPSRPTWIILDDAERSKGCRTAEQRDELSAWFTQVVENLGEPGTRIDAVGTLLHRDALLARLAQRPDATARTFRSILTEPDNQELWREWRRIYRCLEDPHRVRNAREFFKKQYEAMLAGTSVLWKEREDYYTLATKRENMGERAFNQEKQNQPPLEGAGVFRIGRLRRFTLADGRLVCEPPRWDPDTPGEPDPGRPEVPLSDLRVYGFLDPALGAGEGRGDYAAIATVGIDGSGYGYVLDVWMARATPSEQIERLFELHAQWDYAQFGIETNCFQKLLLDPLESERSRRKRRGERCWNLPVIERRHSGDKLSRILKLEPMVQYGWLMFNEALSPLFFAQLEEFPEARHDDGPDALAAAWELARRDSSSGLSERPLTTPRRSRRAPGGF